MSRYWRALLGCLGGAGAGLALPQIANLVGRWSADDITPVANGAQLPSWTDGVGGVVAAQATGANQPTYVVNAMGTKPGVKVNGSQWFDIASPGAILTAMNSADFTILVVVSNTTTAANGCVFGNRSTLPGHFYANTGAFVGLGNSGTNTVPNVATALTSYGALSTSATAFAGAFQRGFCNASVVWQGAGGANSPGNADLGIGASCGTGTFPSKCTIYEIFIWKAALTPADLYQAEAYIRNKYSQATPWSAGSAIIVYDGDSITANQQPANNTIVQGYPYQSAQALGLTYGQWTMVGVSGINLVQMNTKVSELSGIAATTGNRLVLAAWEYYNSKGSTGATNYASAQTLIASYKALTANVKVVWGSAISHGTEPDANRLGAGSYCALLDATPLGDYYAQLHLLPHIGVSGGADANPTYYGADLIHPKPLGYSELFPAFTTSITAAIAAP